MTKEEFAALQNEWESIEFGQGELDSDFERQREIEELMDNSPWSLHPDTGKVITKEELQNL